MKTKLFYFFSFFNLIAFCFILYSFSTKESNNTTVDFTDKIIKVRGVVVVDSLGVERVIVGSNLPDPSDLNGNRKNSSRKCSGVMLYDSDGIERGGYLTDDDYGFAILTLDSKKGMNFMAGAGPENGGYLHINDHLRKNQVFISANEYEANIEIKNGSITKIIKDEK